MNFLEQHASRRGFLKGAAAMGLAAGWSASLAACASPGQEAGEEAGEGAGARTVAGGVKDDGTITAAISYELGTNGYDPMTTSAALTVAANWHTLEGLTEIDPATRETYAALATALPATEGTSVEVTLREGATFHDGTPVSADDVVHSFERVQDPANMSMYAQFITFIERVTKKDDRTVTIALKHPTGLLASRLSVVKIVPRAATGDAKAFDAHPIGSGPYRMTDNGAASKQVVFERFDAYTGPRPARAAHMRWQIIADPATRANALQSGGVQVIDSVPYLSIEQLTSVASVDSVQGFGLLFAMFNHAAGHPFAAKENRQAFLRAVDVAKVVQTGLLGQATPATGFLQEGHPDYQRARTVYTHDPDRAREQFARAGLRRIRMLCTDHDWVRKCTPIVAESVTAAGLEVEFAERKSSDLYNTIDGKPDAYDVVIAPGDPSVFGNDPDLLMRWWYAGDVWTDRRMHWKGQASYERVQALLDEGLRAPDAGRRREIWGELYDTLADEVPLYPLLHRKTPTGFERSTLVDFTPIALTGLSFLGVASTK